MADKVDVDKIWKSLGEFRRYNVLLIFYSFFICVFMAGFPVLVYVFVGYSPSHQCKPLTKDLHEYGYTKDYNVTYDVISYDPCHTVISFNVSNTTNVINIPCVEGYKYDTEVETFVTEWNLVCNKAGLGELTQTVWTAGQAAGSLIFPSIADRYGRKLTGVSNMILLLGFGAGASFGNYYIYIIFRFLTGAFQQGFGLTIGILVMEQIPKENRGFVSSLWSLGWGINVVGIATIGYFMRNLHWRYVQLASALIGIHCIAAYWIYDESLRWLIANNRTADAKKIIKRVARINKVNVEEVLLLLGDEREVTHLEEPDLVENTVKTDYISESTSKEKSTERENILTILKHATLLKTFLIMAFTWLTNALVYYGLILTSTQLAGDKYLNFFINVGLELPAMLSFMFLVKRYKRKQISVLYHSIAAISLILSVILGTLKGHEAYKTASIVFSFIGKFGITGSFSTIFLWTPELYPTNLRNIGLGLGSIVARIGGMFAPYSSMLATHIEWGPGIIFGIFCLITTVLQLFLPETSGKELPQSVKELREWDKKRSNKTENGVI